MDLGTFSVSLPVKDLETSIPFYEAFGFRVVHDAREQDYVVLEQGTTKVGLFQGMFERPILTFNPDGGIEAIHAAVQGALAGTGAEVSELQEGYGEGGRFFTAKDPDGHDLMVDFFGTPPEDAGDGA